MKVLVLGNMGSGKTATIDRLSAKYVWHRVAIDDFRRRYGRGTKQTELRARRKFFEAAQKRRHQFIECVGVGKVSDGLFEQLKHSKDPMICLILLAPKAQCRSRIRNRRWDVPFPAPREKAYSFIDRMHVLIREGMIEKKWSRRKNTLIIKRTNRRQPDLGGIVHYIATLIEQAGAKAVISSRKKQEIEDE